MIAIYIILTLILFWLYWIAFLVAGISDLLRNLAEKEKRIKKS